MENISNVFVVISVHWKTVFHENFKSKAIINSRKDKHATTGLSVAHLRTIIT